MGTISQYFIPEARSDANKRLGWCREALQEAMSYLERQPGFKFLDRDLEIISRDYPSLMPGMTGYKNSEGDVRTGAAKSKISEIIATLSNLEPLWKHTPNDKRWGAQGHILDKCTWAWWSRTQSGQRIKEAIQWSAVNRTGYIFPKWNPHFHGLGIGDIELKVGGPKDFLVLWPNKSFDIQQAYAGIIREEMPVTEAWATWPTMREQIKPDQEQASWWRGFLNLFTSTGTVSPDYFQSDVPKDSSPGSCPTVMIYYMYVRDATINQSPNSVPMGIPRAPWSYTVPYLGQDIPTGLVNPHTGQDLTRKAREEDAYLYPNRRLVIFHARGILYDGPSHYFHGRVPAVKLTLDPWPWSFLGGSMVRDVASLEEASNKELQAFTKRAELKHKPPMAASDGYAASEAESLGTILDTAGAILKDQDFSKGDTLRNLLPAEHYQVMQWELENFKLKDQLMEEVLGLNSMKAMAELRQQPSGDTMEKLLQIKGSRTQSKGHQMESFCSELGQLVYPNILQFYDTKRRWTLFGFDGVTKQDFDFDPGSLIPVELPGTMDGSSLNGTRYQRARSFQRVFQVEIEPDSLLEITSMTRQLLALQLWKDQRFPIDPKTLSEILKLQNFGQLDDAPGVDTMVGRFKQYMDISTTFQAMLQVKAQKIAMAADPQALLMQMLQGAMGGTPDGGQPTTTGGQEGRPPSFQNMPRLETRSDGEGGQREVVNTSR